MWSLSMARYPNLLNWEEHLFGCISTRIFVEFYFFWERFATAITLLLNVLGCLSTHFPIESSLLVS